MRQAGFAAALLDPGMAVPEGLTGPGGTPAGRRFAVYRNNVVAGLTRALERAFPAVLGLVGAEFFAAMAGVFLRAHPPEGRQMMLYGARFPDWLAQFPPVAHLGYLPDVARLEQAIRESYHAGDARPADLSGRDPAALMACRVVLAPSLRLVRSRWPVVSVRAATLEGGSKPVMAAEDALVLRPGFDPEVQVLPAGGGAVVADLMSGATLGVALARDPGLGSQVLQNLLAKGAVVEVR